MASTLRPIASLLLGLGFLLAGNGLQVTLLPLAAERAGFNALSVGLIGSSYYIGFVAGCLLGPFVIVRAGHIRAFGAMVSLASAVALVHPMIVDPTAWAVLRGVTGFCLAAIYLIVESWLNDRATNSNRGFVMSAYIIVNYATMVAGQMLVALYPVTAFQPFALASILASIAVVPVALTRSGQPAPITLVRFDPRAMWRRAPVGVVGAFVIGVANGAFWTLGPVFGSGSGLSVSDTAVFMSVAVAAGALAQWPVGRISDRLDRRVVLTVLLVFAAAASAALSLMPPIPVAMFATAFLFGALTLPGYSLAAAHAYDRTPVGGYVETAAGILLINGLGAVAGPPIAAMAIQALGPSGLFAFIAATQVLLALYVGLRLLAQTATPKADKTDFDLAATAPMGVVVTKDPLDPSHPHVIPPSLAANAD